MNKENNYYHVQKRREIKNKKKNVNRKSLKKILS